MKVTKIRVKNIEVIGSQRPIKKKKLRTLKESVAAIGLLTPIAVIATVAGRFTLVAGQYRLEAARLLGRTEIPAFVIKSGYKGKRWSISENLHRAELSALERADSLQAWEKLRNKVVQRSAEIRESPKPPKSSARLVSAYDVRGQLLASREKRRTRQNVATLPTTSLLCLKLRKSRSPASRLRKCTSWLAKSANERSSFRRQKQSS
jgi:ParB/RepB/Spo0J family partition protein